MIAVDTNVLVRYVIGDNAEQAQHAVALLGNANGMFVAKTVLLETEWVLRAVYDLPPKAVRKALLHVCGLSDVVVEDEYTVPTRWMLMHRDWISPMPCIGLLPSVLKYFILSIRNLFAMPRSWACW